MTTVQEMIVAVKEDNLSKFDLEILSSKLDILSAEMELELADIQKRGAIFLNTCGEKTRAMATLRWDASEDGQKEITLKKNIRAINKLGTSVKTRIYQKY